MVADLNYPLLGQTPRLGEPAIGCDEPIKHWYDQAHRISDRLARLTRQDFGIGDEITVELCGQFHRDFDGLIVGDRSKFQFCHSQPL